MSRKRKVGDNEETDQTKKSKLAQDSGRQPACTADQAPTAKAAAAKGTDGRSSKAADASQQGADETDE
jgi:hypothetical protein